MGATDAQRHEAHLADRDVSVAIRLGQAAAIANVEAVVSHLLNRFVATKSRAEVMHSMRALLPPAIQRALLPAMVYAQLAAWKRVPRVATQMSISMERMDNIGGAVDFLRRRLDFPVARLRRMSDSMNRHALLIAKDASAAAEKRVQRAFIAMTKRSVHVREGVAILKREFEAAGIAYEGKHQLEAVFRTQTMLAYSAAEQEIDQSPEIDEILWGYTYVTVGDDRVRPAHEAIDGVTLPKDDPFWIKNRPPNGWNCRCRLIRVFEPAAVVKPPRVIRVGDKKVTPGADDGFQYSPLALLSA